MHFSMDFLWYLTILRWSPLLLDKLSPISACLSAVSVLWELTKSAQSFDLRSDDYDLDHATCKIAMAVGWQCAERVIIPRRVASYTTNFYAMNMAVFLRIRKKGTEHQLPPRRRHAAMRTISYEGLKGLADRRLNLASGSKIPNSISCGGRTAVSGIFVNPYLPATKILCSHCVHTLRYITTETW